jgi:hypothetical protein
MGFQEWTSEPFTGTTLFDLFGQSCVYSYYLVNAPHLTELVFLHSMKRLRLICFRNTYHLIEEKFLFYPRSGRNNWTDMVSYPFLECSTNLTRRRLQIRTASQSKCDTELSFGAGVRMSNDKLTHGF